ncbi:hypothetical protein GCM10025868_15640 [Angustibacter aerolatus]|uniref:Secreted protein n=1 Tax=Angustibacter aerolatus TaxID=1162965 RepID=A0ABQ6JGR2_9ACTN|nr:hypothetical protein [Angustibacter aerolatus]GMA86314.1 hypothetical protein GCM10025868_15640 [Angustibacter aerolatus]
MLLAALVLVHGPRLVLAVVAVVTDPAAAVRALSGTPVVSVPVRRARWTANRPRLRSRSVPGAVGLRAPPATA